MTDIYGSHFEYGDINSAQYNLILANVETKRMQKLCGTKEGKYIFNKKSNKRQLVADDLTSSPLSFDVDIVTESGRNLEAYERRTIEKWLFGKRGYRKLYIDSIDTYEYAYGKNNRCYLNCRFVNPEKIEGNGGVIGYKATLEADSDMFWQDPTTVQITIGAHPDKISSARVHVDTDSDEYIYPKVVLHVGEIGGEVTIYNESDDVSRVTKFKGLSPQKTILMNGELNYVDNDTYENLVSRNFIRLVDGVNTLCIIGDIISIEIKYSPRRFIG